MGVRLPPSALQEVQVTAVRGRVTACTLELEERRLLQAEGAPTAAPAAITALGVDVAVFDDADAFATSPASLLSDENEIADAPPEHFVARGWSWPPRVAAESFVSYGVFAGSEGVSAHARLAGTVVNATKHTAAVTGQSFVAARVRTVGFDATVCLPADEVEKVPRPGNVIHGNGVLVGSIDVPGIPVPPKRRSLFRRARM